MPDILLVRMSSMGDLIHTYPALTDLQQHFPDTRIDWVAEEAFAELPPLHPLVRRALPVAWRRWRKSLWRSDVRREIVAFYGQLRAQRYDLVIDSQGLLKSGLVTALAHGLKGGYDRHSAREGLAAFCYDKTYAVPRGLLAVERNRQLFARIFGYTLTEPVVFGLQPRASRPAWLHSQRYAVLLHATSRSDKEWPVEQWLVLGRALQQRGLELVLPWGNAGERQRSLALAEQLRDQSKTALVPPATLSLAAAAIMLQQAVCTVGVDTGLTHLANAVDCPLVAIYTATDPGLTGVSSGPRACNLGGIGQLPTASAVLERLTPWLS